jgi:phage pi2 protein 07
MSTAKIVIEKKEYEELKEKARILDNMNNKYHEPIVFRDKGNLEENFKIIMKK